MRFAAFLLLVACDCVTVVPRPNCATRCGLRASENCAELQEAETAIIDAADRYSDFDAADICRASYNWIVRVHAVTKDDRERCRMGWWDPFAGEDLQGRCVSGLAHEFTPYHVIEIDDAHWHRNALAHELFHVADMKEGKHTGPWHCEWNEKGRMDAIFEATGLPDPTKPEKRCAPEKPRNAP